MTEFHRLPQIRFTGTKIPLSPRLPIRLMTSLLYLKHAYNVSDEELVERCDPPAGPHRRVNLVGFGGLVMH